MNSAMNKFLAIPKNVAKVAFRISWPGFVILSATATLFAGWAKAWLVIGAIVCWIISTGSAKLEQIRAEREAERASREAELASARAVALEANSNFMNRLLGPFTTQLELAAVKGITPTERSSRAAAARVLLVSAMRWSLGGDNADHVRTCFYKLTTSNAPRILTRDHHSGPRNPRRTFEEGTEEGDWVFAKLDRDIDVYVSASAEEDKPPMWGAASGAYTVFIATPVYGGAKLLGMLTVDSSIEDALCRDDTHFLRVIGKLLAVTLML